jgi:Zn-dependent protease with chaperone function
VVLHRLSFYVITMLSPLLAPIVTPWAARTQEKHADRVATDLGYGVLLVQIFSGRGAQRGPAGERALRQGLFARQPNESARLRALEKYLSATAGTRHLRASATWGKNRRQVDHGAHSGRRRPGGNELVA